MVTFREVVKSSHKKHTYDLVMRYIGRPLSYPLLWLLYPLGVTGNHISLASIFLFLVPFFLIASGDRIMGVIGTAFLLFNIVLDCSDGGMARLRGEKSLKGRYLEYMFHEICVPLLFFGLGIYSFKYFDNYYMLILGSITMFAIFLTSVSRLDKHRIVLEYSLKIGKLPKKTQEHALVDEKSGSFVRRLLFYFIVVFNSIGHMFFILFLLSVFGFLQYAIIFYSVFYLLVALIKFYIELKTGFEGYGLE